MKLAVMVSGTGSILEAMLADNLPVSLVVADRECRGVEIAKSAGVEVAVIDRKAFGFPEKNWDRNGFTESIVKKLQQHDIELVAMAGFMTILADSIFISYKDKILNTHPALLPAFKGDNAVRESLEYGVKVTGCTIHVATPVLDDGPIIAQRAVEVKEGDTVETLHERIKQVERVLYPETLRSLMKL